MVEENGGNGGGGKRGGRSREKRTAEGRREGGTCHNDKSGLIECERKIARGEERRRMARPAAMASRVLVERSGRR